MKWSWGFQGERESSSPCGDATARSVLVGSRGRESPMVFLKGSMGCRGERSLPCEWLTGDTVYWLWNGVDPLTEPQAGWMQRRRAAGLLAKIAVYYTAHLAVGTY